MNQEKTIQSIKAWTPRQPVKELMDLLADLDRGFQKDKLIEDLPLSEKYKNELAGLSHYPIWACDNDGNCLVGDSADAIEPAAAIIEYYKLHGGAREVEAGPEEYHIRKLAAALENVARGHEQSALDRNQITFGFSSGAEELLDMSSRITQSLVELGACHQYTNKSWSLRFDSSDAGDGTDDVDQSSLWLVGEFFGGATKVNFLAKVGVARNGDFDGVVELQRKNYVVECDKSFSIQKHELEDVCRRQGLEDFSAADLEALGREIASHVLGNGSRAEKNNTFYCKLYATDYLNDLVTPKEFREFAKMCIRCQEDDGKDVFSRGGFEIPARDTASGHPVEIEF